MGETQSHLRITESCIVKCILMTESQKIGSQESSKRIKHQVLDLNLTLIKREVGDMFIKIIKIQ